MKIKKIFVIVSIVLWVFWSISVPVSAQRNTGILTPEESDLNRIREIVKQHQDSQIDEYKVFRSPTYPDKGICVIPEWERSEYLVLAIPYTDGFSNEKITKYYMDIIRFAIEYTNVLVLINEQELGALNDLMINLKALGLQDKITRSDSYQLKILTTRFNTKWLRDYGPLFGMNNNNNNCYVIDPIYRDIRTDSGRNLDDEISIYLSNFLINNMKSPIKIVKPPIQLWGGDFQTDGKGNCFVSTETLIMNGGDRADFELILKYYLGMNKIIYLNPLPGQTIKHIDMFFKIVDKDKILIGEYNNRNPYTETSEYHTYLQNEANLILKENYSLLRKLFPEKQIIRMPMPEIEITVNQETINEVYKMILTSSSESEDFSDNAITEMEPSQLKDRAFSVLRAKYKKEHELEAENANWDELLNIFIERRLMTILKAEPDACQYIYKTYLNSTFIKGNGRNLLLVPSYKDGKEMEIEVKERYQSVYPDTDIVFINSDDIIDQYGTIHCVTITIPSIPIGAPQPNELTISSVE